MKAKITLLPGDGIGPEIVDATRQVLEAIASKSGHTFTFSTHLICGIAIDETGVPLPDDTIVGCRSADAVLLGAVGGPKWDDPPRWSGRNRGSSGCGRRWGSSRMFVP